MRADRNIAGGLVQGECDTVKVLRVRVVGRKRDARRGVGANGGRTGTCRAGGNGVGTREGGPGRSDMPATASDPRSLDVLRIINSSSIWACGTMWSPWRFRSPAVSTKYDSA